jgi:hypothetical protein
MKFDLLLIFLLAAVCGSSFAAETKFQPDVVLVDGTRVQFLGSNPDGTANWVTEDGDAAPNVSYADALAMGGTEAQMRRFYPEAEAAAHAKAAGPQFTAGPCLSANPADCRAKALTGQPPVLKPGERISKMPNGLVWVVDANGYPQSLIAIEPPTQTKNPNYDKPYMTITGKEGPLPEMKGVQDALRGTAPSPSSPGQTGASAAPHPCDGPRPMGLPTGACADPNYHAPAASR